MHTRKRTSSHKHAHTRRAIDRMPPRTTHARTHALVHDARTHSWLARTQHSCTTLAGARARAQERLLGPTECVPAKLAGAGGISRGKRAARRGWRITAGKACNMTTLAGCHRQSQYVRDVHWGLGTAHHSGVSDSTYKLACLIAILLIIVVICQ